jgi:UDPglucose 6-dehydrogenase
MHSNCGGLFPESSQEYRMKIVVLGLWHLGCVTAACSAKFARVVGLDFDSSNVASLRLGKAPIFEPGLESLIQEGIRSGSLSFETDAELACSGADLLWVTHDTPVDGDDLSDVWPVFDGIGGCLQHLPTRTIILISSQLPAGTCRRLESMYPERRFAYSPENLRLGQALEIFLKPDRIILGTRTQADAEELREFLGHFSSNIIAVRTESAEVIKHAINSFLAASITLMNEISRICEIVGADAKEVERGLKSESRIGPRAYLSPGGPFAGGTLARDVVALTNLAANHGESLVLLASIKASNDQHKLWALRRLQEELGSLKGRAIAVLGLTYKPGTDTLRRSLAIELCQALLEEGAEIKAYDPAVDSMPEELRTIPLFHDIEKAIDGADGIVVCTEWPQLLEVEWEKTLTRASGRVVIDANGFIEQRVRGIPGLVYRSVGRPRNL